MKSEKFEVREVPVGEGDNSLSQFMVGENYMPGGVHDLEDRGLGSGIGKPNYSLPNTRPAANAEEASYLQESNDVGPTAQELSEAAEWKKRYGDEANEKGLYRKTATEALNELQQLRGELAALRNAAPQTYAQPAQPQPQIPQSFFPNKEEGDLLEVGEVNRILRDMVAPAMVHLSQQQQAFMASQQASQKAALGITPNVERELLNRYSWLSTVPDASRPQAMAELLQSLRPTAPNGGGTGTANTGESDRITRRVTYVERGDNSGGGTPETEVPLQKRVATEFYAAKTSKEKAAVLRKYGIDQVNDWGPDYGGPVR